MKKINASYLAVWAGIPAVVAVVLMVLSFTVFMGNKGAFMVSFIAGAGILVAIPMFLESRMKKMAESLESGFKAQNFTYQYKFSAKNGVYYIDQGGKMGVVWCLNPTELQFVDLNKVTNVRVNEGKFGTSTARVCCEFQLDGKLIRITTLEVTRGRLSLKDKRVLEAISKADQLCSLLNTAKANAKV